MKIIKNKNSNSKLAETSLKSPASGTQNESSGLPVDTNIAHEHSIVGMFGGTFDPIHQGHLTIMKHFIQKCNLDKCYIIPNKLSPHKQNKINMLSDEQRLQLIQAEIKSIKIDTPCNIEISLYEINQNKVSYTINTVQYFHKQHPNAQLLMLIGDDVAFNFNKWKEHEKIIELVQIVIANRINNQPTAHKAQIIELFKNHNIVWLDNPIVDISSTVIRQNKHGL